MLTMRVYVRVSLAYKFFVQKNLKFLWTVSTYLNLRNLLTYQMMRIAHYLTHQHTITFSSINIYFLRELKSNFRLCCILVFVVYFYSRACNFKFNEIVRKKKWEEKRKGERVMCMQTSKRVKKIKSYQVKVVMLKKNKVDS